jgi:hypothetical protein
LRSFALPILGILGCPQTNSQTAGGCCSLDLFFGEFVLAALDGSSPAGKVYFVVHSIGALRYPAVGPELRISVRHSFAVANLPDNAVSVYATDWAGDNYLTSDGLDFTGVDMSRRRLLAWLTLKVDGSAPEGAATG